MNQFSGGKDLSSPAFVLEAITASNTVDLTNGTRGIYVGGSGDIAVVSMDDTVTTFVGVVVGTVLPIVCKRVNLTNTTATNLVGMS